MPIRAATEADIPAITRIYNHAVVNTTAIWNDTEVTPENRLHWLRAHLAKGYPVIVFTDENNRTIGYATFDDWRAWDGYRYTVEHSVYVDAQARGQGVGTQLVRELISLAAQNNKHVMVAGITGDNTGSLRLHKRLGFKEVGLLPQVGTKFGRWLDLVFMQLQLNDAQPKSLTEPHRKPSQAQYLDSGRYDDL